MAVFIIGTMWLVYFIEGATAPEPPSEDYESFPTKTVLVALLCGVGLIGSAVTGLVLAFLGRVLTTIVAALSGLVTVAAAPAAFVDVDTQPLFFWTALVGCLLLAISLTTIKRRREVWPPPVRSLGQAMTWIVVIGALVLLAIGLVAYWVIWSAGIDDPGLAEVNEQDENGWVVMVIFAFPAWLFLWLGLELLNRAFWTPTRVGSRTTPPPARQPQPVKGQR